MAERRGFRDFARVLGQNRWICPIEVGEFVLSSYDRALIPEMNNVQLSRMVKAEFVRPVISYSKVEGVPFKFGEINSKIMEIAGQ